MMNIFMFLFFNRDKNEFDNAHYKFDDKISAVFIFSIDQIYFFVWMLLVN